MLKGLMFIVLTGLLSDSFSATNLDSVWVAPIEVSQPVKKVKNIHTEYSVIRQFSDKKTARKYKKSARKEFRKDHPKSFGQIFLEYILPPISAVALALSQCK